MWWKILALLIVGFVLYVAITFFAWAVEVGGGFWGGVAVVLVLAGIFSPILGGCGGSSVAGILILFKK